MKVERHSDPYNKTEQVSQSDYYQKLQNDIKQKREAGELGSKKIEEQEKKAETQNNIKENRIETDFKDKITLSALDWEKNFSSDHKSQEFQEKQKFLEEMKLNAEKLRRYLGVKIDFQRKIPELKELFIHTIVQSRSHNEFMSKFGQFKVGVVGQILSVLGIPVEELKKLKQTALSQAFEENCDMMSENLYNMELCEIVFGKNKKSKRSMKVYVELQQQLMANMNKIGRMGYWSKTKILEEKIAQCKKIKEEFQKERDQLQYQLEYEKQVVTEHG